MKAKQLEMAKSARDYLDDQCRGAEASGAAVTHGAPKPKLLTTCDQALPGEEHPYSRLAFIFKELQQPLGASPKECQQRFNEQWKVLSKDPCVRRWKMDPEGWEQFKLSQTQRWLDDVIEKHSQSAPADPGPPCGSCGK